MQIESKEYILTLNHSEMIALSIFIKESLIHSIKNHWVKHQDSWKRNEERRLLMLKQIYNHAGISDMYDVLFREIDTIFLEHNKE